MRHYFCLLLGLLSLSLASCRHDADHGPCYGGTVLGETCRDGVLIQVDAAYPIGKPVMYHVTDRDSLAGSNVVAAVGDLGALNVKGQRVYFSYTGSTDQPGPAQYCTANTVRLAVPHINATNLSATACTN
jgi:hypothetical protein